MKALTLYQPFANLCVLGIKRNETRPRRTLIRGTIAVHAGLKQIDAALKNNPNRGFIINLLYEEPSLRKAELYRGGVVGTVDILDCVPVEEIRPFLSPLELAIGDYSPGRWALVLENPVIFPTPYPAKGKQGWWNWEGQK